MTTRRYELLACGLFVCLVGAQVTIKPRLDRRQARNTAELVRRNREWRSRLAPGFELPLRDGSTFRLAEHVGRRVVILNFFTTWCQPCRRELPELQQYVSQLQREGKPLLVVAIDGQERPDVVDRFAAGQGITIPVAIDDPGSVTRAYEVGEFPTTVVIGAEGRVRLYQPDEIPNHAVAFDTILETEFAAIARLDRMGAR